MVIREYPEEIRELMKIYEPYSNRIHNGKLKNAPERQLRLLKK